MSDQDRISPCYINTISSSQVMGIKKNINYGITNWSDTNSPAKIMEIIWQTIRKIANEILGVKGLNLLFTWSDFTF